MRFLINGVEWTLVFVPSDSPELWMGNHYTLGVTDLSTSRVLISNNLSERQLYDVLHHEICHAIIGSYGYFMPIDEEECLCQVLEHHSEEAQFLTQNLFEMII